MNKKAILEAFGKHFPNKRLLALQLDGFSHRIIYDDIPKTPKAHAIEISFCMGEAEEIHYCRSEDDKRNVIEGRSFLREIGYDMHSCFQNNAQEIIFVEPKDR